MQQRINLRNINQTASMAITSNYVPAVHEEGNLDVVTEVLVHLDEWGSWPFYFPSL